MSHFDQKASVWDSEEKVKMMKVLAERTKEKLHLKLGLDFLDFGCGTGLFSLEFQDHAQSILGVDTSQGMLDAFDAKTKNNSSISTRNIDLTKEDLPQKFDVVLSSMAFHHLDKPCEMISTFKKMLKPSGIIAVVDLEKEDGTFHPDNKGMGVKHHGFSREQIQDWAKKASLDLQVFTVNEIDKNDKVYKQFLAVFC